MAKRSPKPKRRVGSRKTKGIEWARTRVRRRPDGPAAVGFRTECLLYAFEERVPLRYAVEPLVLALAAMATRRRPGTNWLVFAGSGQHWAGLSRWVAVTTNALNVAQDTIAAVLPSDWRHEATDFVTPANAEGLSPIFRMSDDGLELLEGSPLDPADVEDHGIAPELRAWQRSD